MRNLFLKIFLWFLLTFVIVAVTLVWLTIATRPSEKIQNEIRARVSLYLPLEAKEAVEIYERDGEVGLNHHFDRLLASGILKPYLLNEDGKDVTGRIPPARAVELAKDAKVDIPIVGNFKGRNGFVAQKAVGASGKQYTVLLTAVDLSFPVLLKELGAKTLFSVLAVLLVGGIFCFWLARHIANPVVQLSETASRIADGWLDARGDRSIRLRRDEIGRLGLSFDRMAERIESLVRGQQRLLGDVSHELRSPLARLSVAEGLLRQCPPEERAEYLDRIELEVKNLDQLIGQLLTLARIDSGADSTHTERIELCTLLQEVAVDGNFEAQAKHCAVRVDSLGSCATAGAGEQLRRAVENVVRNAIRHTLPNTEIGISIRKQYSPAPAKAIIQVRDRGPGVKEEHLEKIFLPFYRVPSINGEQAEGAGLGLAITERIVRMYGGSVDAANAPDGGLIVKLELPLVE